MFNVQEKKTKGNVDVSEGDAEAMSTAVAELDIQGYVGV